MHCISFWSTASAFEALHQPWMHCFSIECAASACLKYIEKHCTAPAIGALHCKICHTFSALYSFHCLIHCTAHSILYFHCTGYFTVYYIALHYVLHFYYKQSTTLLTTLHHTLYYTFTTLYTLLLHTGGWTAVRAEKAMWPRPDRGVWCNQQHLEVISFNLGKYIWQFEKKHFKIWTSITWPGHDRGVWGNLHF